MKNGKGGQRRDGCCGAQMICIGISLSERRDVL